jgi:hypothetical protein
MSEPSLNELMGRFFSAPPTKKDADAPTVGIIRRVAVIPEMRAVDEKNRTIDFVASTEDVDRYGDIIRVKGWKTENYMKNPVFLFQHRSNEPPIGKTIKLWLEANPPALVQRVQFADAKTYPFAETIFRLYQGKFMNATSVGFKPLEDPLPIRDKDGASTGGYEFTSQELLELSAVAVPANPEALARTLHRAVDEGVITCDAEREATKSFLDAFQNPSWSQSVPGVTYAVEEPAASKSDAPITGRDLIELAFKLGQLSHSVEFFERVMRDAGLREVRTPEDLEKLIGHAASISSVDDLERLFKLS